jgi:hypothetical protein
MEPDTTTNPDGHFSVCKLCGERHEVPEHLAPYWNGQTVCHIMTGEGALGCPEKSGTAQYSFSDFKPYQLTTA